MGILVKKTEHKQSLQICHLPQTPWQASNQIIV